MEILPDRPELQAFPYLALVTRTDPTSGNVTDTCAGALVENGWRVLTARQVRRRVFATRSVQVVLTASWLSWVPTGLLLLPSLARAMIYCAWRTHCSTNSIRGFCSALSSTALTRPWSS